MADLPQSSFIPKDTSGMVPGKVRRRRSFHVFGFVATAILIGSLLLAGGVYFLKANAQKELMIQKETLKAQKDLYDNEKAGIAEIRDFDRRLKAARFLLENHISPVMVFTALEEHTKRLVQFTGLSFEHSPGTEAQLTLKGLSPEFRVIALQEHEFSSTDVLSGVIFNQLGVGDESESLGVRSIAFTLEGAVDPKQIIFGEDSEASPAVETSFQRVEVPPSVEDTTLPDTSGGVAATTTENIPVVPNDAATQSQVQTVIIE